MWKLVLSAGLMAGAVAAAWWLKVSGDEQDARAEEELRQMEEERRQMEERRRKLDELEATVRRVRSTSLEDFFREAVAKIPTHH
jgi:hypothetical protein